jgi:hypothetical protein
MRRAVGILTMAVVPVFAAAIALAADPYETSPSHQHETGATSGTMGTSHAGFMGEHTMTGRITDIDKDKGRVTIDAQGEELDLHFPKTALQSMNKGDQVTVSLGIKPATSRGGTSGTSGTSGTRSPSGPGSDYPATR